MRIAMLAPVAWRTPPYHYGPWELVTSLLTEELVKQGIDVTLFATADSKTSAKLESIIPGGYEGNPKVDAKVAECLHISNCFEKASGFDLIHNNFDFLPLTYSSFVNVPVLTTIHGFSSPLIIPVFEKYNNSAYYVSISNADRARSLKYVRTIYHGIDIRQFTFRNDSKGYLVFLGRIHPDKGAVEAIEIAKACGKELIMAGIIQDNAYYENQVAPLIDNKSIHYIGSVGPSQRDELLGGAAALLHPINFKEPFGLAIIEAMACGTPSVAYNRGSMPELIANGTNGFLVNNIEGAVRAVGQIGSIKRVVCRKIVEEKFTVERMTREYIEVYREILGKIKISEKA
jgi:glycosyltransferase involved in cell wall biosynthesis